MHDQGFVPAEARRVLRQLEPVDEAFRSLVAAPQLDAQDSCETAHLTARQIKLRV